MENKRISVSIPGDFYAVVEQEARGEGISVSAFVRKLIMTNYPIKEKVRLYNKKIEREHGISGRLERG